MDDITALPTAPQDSFADARKLLAILASPERHAALVSELKARIAAAEEGAAALVGEREAFDAALSERSAALKLEGEALSDRHVTVVAKQRELGPRRDRLAELHGAWVNQGENDYVCRGLQSPQLGSSLFKARAAYGKLPPAPAPVQDIFPEYNDNPRTDDQGVPFPEQTTLTRGHASRPPTTSPIPAPTSRASRRRAIAGGLIDR
jgi:hypothetical protein